MISEAIRMGVGTLCFVFGVIAAIAGLGFGIGAGHSIAEGYRQSALFLSALTLTLLMVSGLAFVAAAYLYPSDN